MFEWVAFLGGLVTLIGALNAIRRWKPFKWWFTLGYWFNAQTWGARSEIFGSMRGPSCWPRVLPAPVCRAVATFLLAKVESPPEEETEAHLEHQMREGWKVIESWERIAARHERRGWNRHPHGCYNATNRRWCALPGCNEEARGRMVGHDASYYCSEHEEPVLALHQAKARGRHEIPLAVDEHGDFTVGTPATAPPA